IRDAMRFALQEPDLHRAFNQLDMDMETAAANQENLTLSVANSFWGQYDKEFEPSFLEVMARNYGAGLNLLDFAGSPDNSRMTINTWVEGQTNNRIKNLLPPGSITLSTRLVITNAVYFLADWLKTFDPQLTEEKTFYRENGETVQAPLMSLSGSDENAHVIAAVTGKSKAVQLPYVGNRFAMLAVMPREGTLAAYEQEFDSEELQAVVENLDSTEMTVVLPRFTFGTQSFSLTEALGKMGMSIPFSPGADFSGIDGPSSQLFISNIIHKAFIAVDEQGTEAAAATAVMMTDCAVDYNLQFVANRPFIYLIRDCHTGAILFMGRVMDPMDEGQ
ncbi:MAG: serpin family protein, partial [Fibrobacterota bacterium]